jgi:uncharacterized membrane protein YeaQ/YmgE (transglycosylase-associated protein family)
MAAGLSVTSLKPPLSFNPEAASQVASGDRDLTLDMRREGMTLDPGGIIAWLVVGLIAGWLAGLVMKGGGYGLIGDIVIGIVGAFVGGFVFSLITGGGTAGFWGSIAVAFVGAVILIAIVRALPGRSPV